MENNDNTKNYIIVILVVVCLAFGYFTFKGSDSELKSKIEQLKSSNSLLEHQRDSIDKVITLTMKDFQKAKSADSALQIDIRSYEAEIERQKSLANQSRAQLDNLQKSLEETRRKIVDMKAHLANRTGDDLLKSIKLKTTK
jgi:chromosome segregation ATPase